jgi:hypothetical protein
VQRGKKVRLRWSQLLLVALAYCALTHIAGAATIVFSGVITQSTQDGTGPATNNPSLNNIQDLQTYSVTLAFPGSITGPGTYNLTGSNLTFSVPAAPATESSFGSISLTIIPNGVFDDLSLLGCLTTGSGCFVGNQLTGDFRIPAALLNSQNVAAIGLDQPHPLDLLEDDGTTDIHGSVTTYSYTGPASPVPEPSSLVVLGCALAGLVAANRRLLRR